MGIDDVEATIQSLLEGHTNRSEEAQILDAMNQLDGADLSTLLARLDLDRLVSAIDDRALGPDNRTALFEMLARTRLAELDTRARALFIGALQRGHTGRQREEAIRDVITGTHGEKLTALKNAIDRGGDYRDLQQLVHHDIDNAEIRKAILDHIATQGAAVSRRPELKVLSDIDDTLYSSLKDKRYPKGVTYPGIVQLYRELLRGAAEGPTRDGQLLFLTARPRLRTGDYEDHTHTSLQERGAPEATILSGSFIALLSHSMMADKKFENFVEYQALFPEYNFVFIGDSGQGDAQFGARMRAEYPGRVCAVMIHDVRSAPQEERDEWREKGVHFVDTYVGAGLKAAELGLIHKDGVQRIADAAESDLEGMGFEGDEALKGPLWDLLGEDLSLARG